MANRRARIPRSPVTSSRRAGWAAWVASLTILVVAWAPLLGTLHQALVRHVICEHGDLIEPDELGTRPARHANETTAPHQSDADSGPSVASGTGASLHEHSHCSVGTLARSVATMATSSGTGALMAEGRAVSLAARDANPVRSVLSGAPKTSPPASQQTVLL
jgi:hypothetical protein